MMFEHVFFVLMVVVLPVVVYRSARDGGASDLPALRNYLRNLAPWLLPPALLVYKWIEQERCLSELGLQFDASQMTGVLAVFIMSATGAFLVASGTELGQQLLQRGRQARGGKHAPRFPQTGAEFAAFGLLDIAESISDEVIYRGFIFYYTASLLPTGVALALTVAVFAGSEAYRGRDGIYRAATLGFVNVVLLILTGTIWLGLALQLGWRFARLLALFVAGSRGAGDQ